MIGPGPALFDLYPPAARPDSPLEALGNAGGLSGARLWKFQSARGPLVARLWPSGSGGRPRLERVHAWIASAGDLGFVPVPVAAVDGRTVAGDGDRLWEVSPWMPGEAEIARPPGLDHLRAAFAGLAAFHARLGGDRAEGPSPGLVERASEIGRLLSGGFADLRELTDRAGDDPASTLIRAWLDRATAMAPRMLGPGREAAGLVLPIQPCLRDARPDHFLFEGGRLSGLVDFGAMGRDSVASDLARLLGEGVGPDRASRREALDAYEAIRPLSGAEARAIGAFERGNALLGPARWARWHLLDRRTFDDPGAVLRGLRRGLERLDEAGSAGGGGGWTFQPGPAA